VSTPVPSFVLEMAPAVGLEPTTKRLTAARFRDQNWPERVHASVTWCYHAPVERRSFDSPSVLVDRAQTDVGSR